MLSIAPTYSAVLESSDGDVWVVSRESLTRMKAMSGRLEDLADVQALQGGDDE